MANGGHVEEQRVVVSVLRTHSDAFGPAFAFLSAEPPASPGSAAARALCERCRPTSVALSGRWEVKKSLMALHAVRRCPDEQASAAAGAAAPGEPAAAAGARLHLHVHAGTSCSDDAASRKRFKVQAVVEMGE